MKKFINLYILLAAIMAVTCSKKEPSVGYILNNTKAEYQLPVSETPISTDVIVNLTYDFTLGEYVLTSNQPVPCDIKFSATHLHGTTSNFVIKKGTQKINYPFNRGDNNAPDNFYVINSMRHLEPKAGQKDIYEYGNITYRFKYATPANTDRENQD